MRAMAGRSETVLAGRDGYGMKVVEEEKSESSRAGGVRSSVTRHAR